MPNITNNLYVDFEINNISSYSSTKAIDLSRGSIYAIDDIFNLKFISKSEKKMFTASTIKLDLEEISSNEISSTYDNYFFDINKDTRVLIAITKNSEMRGIRIKQSTLLKKIG